MTKDEIKANLNQSTMIKAGGIGASLFPLLLNTPSLIVHPNFQNIVESLLPVMFIIFFASKLKEQTDINQEIIKKHKIKDYKTVIPDSVVSGLIGGGTLTFFLLSIQKYDSLNTFLFLFSAIFLIPEIIRLKNIINHNEQQIDKSR